MAGAAAWIYLLAFHGAFWRERPTPPRAEGGALPGVVAVVPARDEADVVGTAVASLLGQTYAGPFHVVLVDDHSSDGTAAAAAAGAPAARLTILAAPPLQPGWTGKLWAVAQGLEEARRQAPDATYVLLTDADIEHDPDNLAELVARAEQGRLDLVSLMVRLPCRTWVERLLVPAYLFFFQMLYPFAWVRDVTRSTAAAAGGCMLVRRAALDRMGGLATIRAQVIDDCALARAVKPGGGGIWLGLADRTRSLRGYPRPGDMWRLIARSAYSQLRLSPWLLAVTVAGMGLVYLAPPLLAATGGGLLSAIGVGTWLAMTIVYVPTLRHCRCSPFLAPLLPAVALFYFLATLDSARRHWTGRGGAWKGRTQAVRCP